MRKPLRFFVMTSESINNQIRNKIKINGGAVHYHGYSLSFPHGVGMGTLSKLYWKGEKGFEESTSRVLIELFKLNSVFFDIGSNFGFYSVLSKKVNPDLQVIAFEPFQIMARQNDLFRIHNDVKYTLIPKGVSDANRLEEFFVPEMLDQEKEVSTASFQKEFFFNTKFKSKSLKVECITLDTFVKDFFKSNMPEKGFCLKIDVEGHEMAVLRGSEQVLKSLRPMFVCEIDFKNAIEALEYFQRLNFEIFHIQPLGVVKFNAEDFLLKIKKNRDFLICPVERIKGSPHNFIAYHNFASAFQ